MSSRPGLFLRWIGALAAAVIISVGLSRISLDVDILRLLPPHLPEVRGLGAYLEHFTAPDELYLVMEGDDASLVEEAAESLSAFLAARPGLVSAVKFRSAWEEDLEGLSELLAYMLLNRPPEAFDRIAAGLAPGASRQRLDDSMERIAFALSPEEAILGGYDAFGLFEEAFGSGDGANPMSSSGGFSSEDGTFHLLVVYSGASYERGQYRPLKAWIGEIRAAVEDWRKTVPGAESLRIRLTGEPAIMSEVAQGMERDMTQSAFATLTLVAIIFWVWYRRLLALGLLLGMLSLIFLITLGLAGLVIGDLTVMNVGFASILIGLSVDYGILVFQDSLRHPGDAPAVRRRCRRGILCAGATTAVAFASLSFSSLPSIAELGLLVAIGIGVGALTMLTLFSSLMARFSRGQSPEPLPQPLIFRPLPARSLGVFVLLLVLAAAALLATRGLPESDLSEKSTRPRVSEAYDALDAIYERMGQDADGGLLMIAAPDPATWRTRWNTVLETLPPPSPQTAFPLSLDAERYVPQPEFEALNLHGPARDLVAAEPRLLAELEDAGFSGDAALLLQSVLGTWRSWLDSTGPIVPTSDAALRIMGYHVRFEPDGSVWSRSDLRDVPEATITTLLQSDGVYIADWDRTMLRLQEQTPKEMLRLLTALGILVLVMLAFTFRRASEVLWVALSVVLSLTLLLGAMRWLDWTWNVFNLAAILLTLGAGLDYSIHMLLALRRHGDATLVQRDTGQALFVCALSSVGGFGSLSWASNLGLASLGQVCALALFLNALVAIFLLPLLWQWSRRGSSREAALSDQSG